MLTASLDMGQIAQTLDSMAAQLAGFPQEIADELTNWQAEDMRRTYPNTVLRGNEATTVIWPTSRLPQKKTRTGGARLAVRRAVRGMRVRIKRRRPILRPELFEKLDERMVRLMGESLQWR
jgi:hypothetical protein